MWSLQYGLQCHPDSISDAFRCLVAGSAECASPDAFSNDAAQQDSQYTELRAAGRPQLLAVNRAMTCADSNLDA